MRAGRARALRRPLRIVCLILGAVLLARGLLADTPPPKVESGSVAGQLLVATPDLHDPNFDHAVIYMVRHDANGAMGLVVNDPIRDVPLATVFEQAGLDPAGIAGTIHLHAGGPVQRTRFVVLHTDDYAIADTLRVGDGLAVTSHIDILRAVAAGTGPRRTLFVVGYAGWGPGQLDAELSAGAWVHATSDEGIVFDQADQTKWHRAFARRVISL
jgi:putative transcriptional regulator